MPEIGSRQTSRETLGWKRRSAFGLVPLAKNLFIILLFCWHANPSATETVRTQEDVQRLTFFEQLRQIQPRETSATIPRVLHFVWLGSSPFPEESIANLRKWRALHPQWKMYFWTDIEDRSPPLPSMHRRLVQESTFAFLEECFSSADNLGERAKLLAYEVLYSEGGVYVDHDCAPCKPLDDLLTSSSLFCGLERETPTVLSSSIYPSTHLLGSLPGNKSLAAGMRWLAQEWDRMEMFFPGNSPSAQFNRAAHRTLWALSMGIESCPESARVFPASFFSEPFATQESYAVHSHAASWHRLPSFSAEEARIQQLIESSRVPTLLFLCSGCIGLASILLSFLSYRKRALIAFFLITTPALFSGEFEEWMGQGTPHWSHLQQQRDLHFFQKCAKLFQEPSSPSKKQLIPHTIHFIWLGPKPFPPESVENVRSWIAKHPGWACKFWTDRPRQPPCQQMIVQDVNQFTFRYLGKRFEASSNWGEKADILRFEILLQEGGVYVDHDARCLKSFEPFHQSHDFYSGFETPHPPILGRCLTVGNGIIGARPDHPIVEKVLELIDERWDLLEKKFRGRDGYTRTQRVMERTYIVLTEALEGGLSSPGIVFPAAYFFPKGGIPALYSQHYYANSWADENVQSGPNPKRLHKNLSQLESRISKLYLASTGLFGLNLLAFLFLFFYYRRQTT